MVPTYYTWPLNHHLSSTANYNYYLLNYMYKYDWYYRIVGNIFCKFLMYVIIAVLYSYVRVLRPTFPLLFCIVFVQIKKQLLQFARFERVQMYFEISNASTPLSRFPVCPASINNPLNESKRYPLKVQHLQLYFFILKQLLYTTLNIKIKLIYCI